MSAATSVIYYEDNRVLVVKNHLSYEEKFRNFKQFVWNGRERELLGRTKESWAKICCFYFCFYTILGGVFAGSVAVYLASLDYRVPKYHNEQSVFNRQRIDNEIIGINPGMGFRPRSIDERSSLIRVRSNVKDEEHPHNYLQYTQQLDKYLEWYLGEEVFLFGPNNPCNTRYNYDYDRARPCMLLKLNRIFSWSPVAYAPEDELPVELRPFEKLVREYPEYIYVLCEGENPVDKDLIGEIEYYSKTPNGPGVANIGFIEFASYPWIIQDDYYTPLVFAHFKNLTTNVLINVMCKSFAKNININTLHRVGSVHFELLIE